MTSQLTILLLATLAFYSPIIVNPSLLLARSNDLQEQFWPIFYFIHQQLVINHSLPLWNSFILSGTPLLPDPQFSFFYPPNWLMILLPTDLGFLLFLLLHSWLAGIGFYLLLRQVLRLNPTVSLISAILYLTTPHMGGLLAAGHYGLVATMAWLPLTLWASFRLAKKPALINSLVLAVCLAALFFTHTVIFILTAILNSIYFAYLILTEKRHRLQACQLYLFSLILTFGLTAVNLLPQLYWLPLTNRSLLLTSPDVYPKWLSHKEFVTAVFFPWLLNLKSLQQLDSEKWLTIGIIPLLLAGLGFLTLKPKLKLLTVIIITIVLLISLNDRSPLKSWLISQDWYRLMRVSSRIFFVVTLSSLTLVALALSKLVQLPKWRPLVVLIIGLAIVESLSLNYIRLFSPTPPVKTLPLAIYQPILADHDRFRLYCTSRCLSQKEAALNNLELADGYNTLIQTNYYRQALQLTGGYWSYYSLSLPPVGLYTFDKPQPNPISLGEYNVKYVISPYPLTSPLFQQIVQADSFQLYLNKSYQPRAYYPATAQSAPTITAYSPNHLQIDVSNHPSDHLKLAEVYSPGWVASLNGQTKVAVQESPNSLRSIDLTPETNFVDLDYQPPGYQLGLFLTATSLIIVGLILARQLKRR